jgi:endogenous inhibitor of DNA gyrase (YacG/DUF329 family)
VPRACAICGKPVAPPPANRSFPFCSPRCQLVDLSKWLGEDYRIAGPRAGDGAARDPAQAAAEEDDA